MRVNKFLLKIVFVFTICISTISYTEAKIVDKINVDFQKDHWDIVLQLLNHPALIEYMNRDVIDIDVLNDLIYYYFWASKWVTTYTNEKIDGRWKYAYIDNAWNMYLWCWNYPPSVNKMVKADYNWVVIRTCPSYVSSWTESWSDCSINSNWIFNGTTWTITCSQTNLYTPVIIPAYTSTSTCVSDAPKPATRIETKTLTMNLSSPEMISNNVFANNSDIVSFKININLSWLTNWNKPVVWLIWTSHANISNITDDSWIKSNRLSNIWDNAINLSNKNSTINWSWNNFSFNITWITSVSPFQVDNWKISFILDWIKFNISNIPYKFKKLFTWKLEASKDNWITWDSNPKIWTSLKYKLSLNKLSILTTWTLENYISKVVWLNSTDNISSSITIQDKKLVNSNLSNITISEFTARVNNLSTTKLDNDFKVWFAWNNLPIVSYTLAWKSVKYYLSGKEAGNDLSPIIITSEGFVWTNVKWTKQTWSSSKTVLTWQWDNFSDLSEAKMRSDIRKNAYSFIKSMKSWTIVNGVAYFVWDIKMSEITWVYETIVIKDWNLIIDKNIPSQIKPLWIIVLRDNYNVKTDYNLKWNVYVNKDIKNINAVIYADWWIISSDNWNPTSYLTDSSYRTDSLSWSLIIKWSMFTRNTIWWAILSNNNYLLPGWINITESDANFNNAMIYDLNYLRTWKECISPVINALWKVTCPSKKYKTTFIIEYDPKIQTNPPKLFVK